MLKDVITKCLKQVHEYGLQSIAFPSLGCGKLKYPVNEVAKCFKEASSNVRGIQVI